jgi:hypothetical protein
MRTSPARNGKGGLRGIGTQWCTPSAALECVPLGLAATNWPHRRPKDSTSDCRRADK